MIYRLPNAYSKSLLIGSDAFSIRLEALSI